MSSLIIINSSHFESTNNRFVYRFPSNMKFTKKHSVSLQSISLRNIFYNVDASKNNNKITVTWNAEQSEQHEIILADGYYTIAQINDSIQKACKKKGLYLTNANQEIFHLVSFQLSPISNECILTIGTIPSEEEALLMEYTVPTDATWAFPQDEKSIQILIPTSIGQLMGLSEGTYPETVSSTQIKFISKSIPQAGKPQSLVLTCNMLFSEYYNPVNVLCTVPINNKFGAIINYCNPCASCSSISEGHYNSINIEFLDQHFNKIHIRDPEVFMTLCIHESA